MVESTLKRRRFSTLSALVSTPKLVCPHAILVKVVQALICRGRELEIHIDVECFV